jgi:segregation and condensation protein A
MPMSEPADLLEQARRPLQSEMPFAVVQGTPISEPPKDLYIPPDALEIFLEAFEGPLDLLLYLIKRQNLDILDIPVAHVTEQYMSYIDLMEEIKLELAAEYLVMAALLAEIKSRMLLPRPHAEDNEEDDPRAELVRRLQEYERYKKAADDIDALPRLERDLHKVFVPYEQDGVVQNRPDVSLDSLLEAFREVLGRAEMFANHRVQRETLSVRERMALVMDLANRDSFIAFTELFTVSEGRAGVVVTLIAILELLKETLIEIVQNSDRGQIYVKLVA